ncbi:hypothetical protein FO519_007671, partial [Halicephalobus sp. NKZ332]
MKRLVPIESEEEINEAVEATRILPDFLSVHQLFFFRKSNPKVDPEDVYYYYEDEASKDRVYIIARKVKNTRIHSYFTVMNSKLTAKFEKNSFFEALSELKIFFLNGFNTVGACVLCTEPVTSLLQEW